ncbi:DMT family transporter [Desulfosporosinus youngiae]|uniref:DMT(Drug/metabolite transporter) superfamily permease n=1 Tax=Desulfosporosinus youngiae DSM 17734 TaxID=768710 RepID=H5XWN3_9FIRM|nr:EamA family transporter [Desulfosporosinus youngiae]EHQ90541.1 DMT(drug/metabolite transporter) superfamily permease [Desulfosporosinus youngiae DSM 17734]
MQADTVIREKMVPGGWTQKKADGAIALVAMVWGASYLLMKVGLEGIAPLNMIALRCCIAFAATALIFNKKVRKADGIVLQYGAVLGLVIFAIFGFIMYGLKTTTASAAGFLCSTTVVFVPILQIIITRKKTQPKVMAGTVFTIMGIALLTIHESLSFDTGAALCIAGAFFYACHIILTDRFIRRVDGLLLGVYQLGFAGLYGLIASFIFEMPSLPVGAAQWGAIMGLALVSSAFGFVMQSIAQKYTTPEHTGLLYALEPVFSALFAFVLLREILAIRGYIGALMVLCGILIPNIKSRAPD